MNVLIFAPLALLVAFAMFVWWRNTSVARGARKRDEALASELDAIAERLDRKEAVTTSEVEKLAEKYELRPLLFDLLDHYERTELFPASFLTVGEQAKARLAYWMMHPNELQNPPVAIEEIESAQRMFLGHEVQFVVLRYRMPVGHWAGHDWLLGIAGPFLHDDPPFRNAAGGFSRADDREGSITPAALVDWYAGMLTRKFGAGA